MSITPGLILFAASALTGIVLGANAHLRAWHALRSNASPADREWLWRLRASMFAPLWAVAIPLGTTALGFALQGVLSGYALQNVLDYIMGCSAVLAFSFCIPALAKQLSPATDDLILHLIPTFAVVAYLDLMYWGGHVLRVVAVVSLVGNISLSGYDRKSSLAHYYLEFIVAMVVGIVLVAVALCCVVLALRFTAPTKWSVPDLIPSAIFDFVSSTISAGFPLSQLAPLVFRTGRADYLLSTGDRPGPIGVYTATALVALLATFAVAVGVTPLFVGHTEASFGILFLGSAVYFAAWPAVFIALVLVSWARGEFREVWWSDGDEERKDEESAPLVDEKGEWVGEAQEA